MSVGVRNSFSERRTSLSVTSSRLRRLEEIQKITVGEIGLEDQDRLGEREFGDPIELVVNRVPMTSEQLRERVCRDAPFRHLADQVYSHSCFAPFVSHLLNGQSYYIPHLRNVSIDFLHLHKNLLTVCETRNRIDSEGEVKIYGLWFET